MALSGILYFIKTFKYKKITDDDFHEDDYIYISSNAVSRPSISTQTSTLGINKDNLSTTSTGEQEINKKH